VEDEERGGRERDKEWKMKREGVDGEREREKEWKMKREGWGESA
jgi:hypothetical protein